MRLLPVPPEVPVAQHAEVEVAGAAIAVIVQLGDAGRLTLPPAPTIRCDDASALPVLAL